MHTGDLSPSEAETTEALTRGIEQARGTYVVWESFVSHLRDARVLCQHWPNSPASWEEPFFDAPNRPDLDTGRMREEIDLLIVKADHCAAVWRREHERLTTHLRDLRAAFRDAVTDEEGTY